MNPLSDLLSDKSKDIFDDDIIPTLSSANAATDTEPETEADEPTTVEPEKKSESIDIGQIKTMIHTMKDQLDSMLRVLGGEQVRLTSVANPENAVLDTGERIVEGVFTGDKMLGQDGKEYSVSPNYASKSKLVEGDIMKLTITNNGSFIYKQIQPIERIRVTGELVSDGAGQWTVLADGKTYKILTASATFYKGNAGDEVVILIAKDGDSGWGAVENIIHK